MRAPPISSRRPWRLRRAEVCGWRLRVTSAPSTSSRLLWRLRRAEGCELYPESQPPTRHMTSAPSPPCRPSPTRYTWAWCHHCHLRARRRAGSPLLWGADYLRRRGGGGDGGGGGSGGDGLPYAVPLPSP